jgi:hypothetical protein
VGKAGFDDSFDVGLDGGPVFAFFGGAIGKKGFEVAGGYGGEDWVVGYCVVVLYDWMCWSE